MTKTERKRTPLISLVGDEWVTVINVFKFDVSLYTKNNSERKISP